MSRCENCKNYKSSDEAACEFAKYMSVVDEAKTDMEFPCDDAAYQEYLDSKELGEKEAAVGLAS